MTREKRDELKNNIRQSAGSYLKTDKRGRGYVCPLCGSGNGRNGNGSGITTKDGVHFTCWAGCFTHCDILDIIGLEYGLENYHDKLTKAAELINCAGAAELPGMTQIRGENIIPHRPLLKNDDLVDYSNFFDEAHKNIVKTKYHRGLTLDTLHRFKVGYVASWRHPKFRGDAPLTPRLIIPIGPHSYFARDTRANIPSYQSKYNKLNVGPAQIFNAAALTTATGPVFVVEGEIDALSVIDVGGVAVALGSASNWRKLCEILESRSPPLLVLALDNDDAGNGAKAHLMSICNAYEIPFSTVGFGAQKDANAMLMADRQGLQDMVMQAQAELFSGKGRKE